MVASTVAWDLTGSKSQLPSGSRTGESSSTGRGTTSVSETSSQVQSTSRQNTPQSSLDALERLIAQLSDRPNLSDQEASAQFPLSVRIFNPRAGWGYKLPNGATVFGPTAHADAQRWDQRQLASRAQAQQASGITKGGTAATSEQTAARSGLTKQLQESLGGFSKESAFADASALAGRFQRQLLEQLMPQLTQAIESSGTSGGAVGGLLAQDAATRVAEAQAQLGLQTAVQYGQLSNQMATILAELATNLPPEMQALLQALGISKGTIDQGVTTSSSTSNKSIQQEESKGVDTKEQQSGLTGLLSNLKILPQAGVQPPTTVPQVVGASPALDETLNKLVRSSTFGGGYQF